MAYAYDANGDLAEIADMQGRWQYACRHNLLTHRTPGGAVYVSETGRRHAAGEDRARICVCRHGNPQTITRDTLCLLLKYGMIENKGAAEAEIWRWVSRQG